MNFVILSVHRSVNENQILDFFFNFSNYCYKDYILESNMELCLTLYIIYDIIFTNTKKIEAIKLKYYKFIFFLFFLISMNFLTNYFWFYPIYTDSTILNIFVLTNKNIIVLMVIFIFWINKNKFFVNPDFSSTQEIPIIFSFLLIFMLVLISAYDFFLIYLAIEGISLVVYTLGSLLNDSFINLEGVIKYFLINNAASTMLLWSISYTHILTGSTNITEIQHFIDSHFEWLIENNLYYCFFFLLLSVLIKLAIFPFQSWIADVFEGFWTPITLCYAVLIKFVYFIFLFKLTFNIFSGLMPIFQPIMFFSAIGSIMVGSLGALIQTRIKRFLAYASITQSGYILLGVSCNTINGATSACIYLFMYCLTNVAFFCILINIENHITYNNISYFNQLYSVLIYNKEISLHIIIIVLTMAGIPPFTSFFAKFLIFVSLIENKLVFIAIIALTFTLISAFYYLNFLQHLIFFKIEDNKKIFFYRKNNILNLFLILNSIFFTLGILWIVDIYNMCFIYVLSCSYPLFL